MDAKWGARIGPAFFGLVLLPVLALAVTNPSAPPVLHSSAPDSAARHEIRALITAGSHAQADSAARALLAELPESDSLRAAYVLDLLSEARDRSGIEDPETRALAERALRIKETLLGPDHPDVAASARNLGHILVGGGDRDGAKMLYERSLAIEEQALGVEDPALARTLGSLSSVLNELGDFAGAARLLERRLAIQEKDPYASVHDRARTLGDLGGNLHRAGEQVRARAFLEQALAMEERAPDPDSIAMIKHLHDLGMVVGKLGEYAAGESLLVRALELTKRTLGPRHARVGYALVNLASQARVRGNMAQAKLYFPQGIEIISEAEGPNHTMVAVSRLNYANLLSDLGDYTAALPHYEHAITTFRENLGGEHPYVAIAMLNLALVYDRIGDFEAARPLYENAVALQEKRLGPDHHDLASNLLNLATSLHNAGDLAAARPHYERSIAIFEKALGADHQEVALALGDFGELLVAIGDFPAARSCLERAASIMEKTEPNHPHMGVILNAYARLLSEVGEASKAKTVLERALELRETTFGPEHPETAKSLSDLAALHMRLGDNARALAYAIRAEEAGRDHVRLTCRTLSERQALAYAASRATGLGVAVNVAEHSPEAIEQAWDQIVRSRAVVLDELGLRRVGWNAEGDSALARRVENLVSARQRLAHLVVSGAGDDPEAYRLDVDHARGEREHAERALAEASVPFRAEQDRERIGLAEVARALEPGDALVAFVEYERWDTLASGGQEPRRGHRSPWAGVGSVRSRLAPSYAALIARASGTVPEFIALGGAREVDVQVRAWRKEISQATSSRDAVGAEVTLRSVGEALRRLVWDPIAERLAGVERVFVVPDGSLHLVNFAALPMNEHDYLVEGDRTIHYLTAERDLIPPAHRSGQAAGLLALGGPDFDAMPSVNSHELVASEHTSADPRQRGHRLACAAFESLRFTALPGAASEVEEIASVWSGNPAGQPTSRTQVLKDKGATEQAFKRSARGWRIVHLATHGFFLGEGCGSIEASTRGIGGMSPMQRRDEEPEAHRTADNPLLLSGLALAGANQRKEAGTEEDDGILTAEEIAGLDLSATEWAVLSACETGIGEIESGEGVLGLQRAFRIAGVSTVIMSLWSVDDQAARAWMRALHVTRSSLHRSTAEAVREASLAVLGERRAKHESTHPFYWGAFIATGDWR